jgi:hypothetical protein
VARARRKALPANANLGTLTSLDDLKLRAMLVDGAEVDKFIRKVISTKHITSSDALTRLGITVDDVVLAEVGNPH